MIKIIKNGVVVSVVLDTRTINKEGTYPVKIKVYYQGKPKYYSVGICLTSKYEAIKTNRKNRIGYSNRTQIRTFTKGRSSNFCNFLR